MEVTLSFTFGLMQIWLVTIYTLSHSNTCKLSIRDRPIYRFADIFGRYRYRYIGIGKLDIGIGLSVSVIS